MSRKLRIEYPGAISRALRWIAAHLQVGTWKDTCTMGVTNSQYLFITNGAGFFRLQYVP